LRLAIHGTTDIARPAGPASHGGVGLHAADAAALFAPGETQGTAQQRDPPLQCARWSVDEQQELAAAVTLLKGSAEG